MGEGRGRGGSRSTGRPLQPFADEREQEEDRNLRVEGVVCLLFVCF